MTERVIDERPFAELPLELSALSTTRLQAALDAAKAAGKGAVVLWPVGSTEPHGPHLPLATDAILSTANAHRAARALRAEGVLACVAPTLPYGVTDFAAGFAGAISIPADTLIALIAGACDHFLGDGFDHVSLINHHLEPGQLDALKAAVKRVAETHGAHAISAPAVISRRWGRQLGDEFKSGACHAGRYEGSLVLAATPDLVDREAAAALPALDISLSAAIAGGQHGFLAAGMTAAYTGDPAAATASEGEALYAVLTEMVKTEVLEHLETRP